MSKIGLGLVTCNREDFCNRVIESIPLDKLDSFVIVNDGKPYSDGIYPDPEACKVIQHSSNMSVGVSKNDALRYMMNTDCDFLFLIEDDILIKNPDVFNKYIELYEKSGIEHFNFGYHGPANKHSQTKEPKPKYRVNYDGISMALNHHCVGAFSFYTRNCIEKCGYIDERYVNCWDHVCLTYKIIKQGLHPQFWWFADLYNSCDYLTEICCSEENSTIRFADNDKWKANIIAGTEVFKSIHGVAPLQIPQVDKSIINQYLIEKMPRT
jgi:GT2 family glycosyltransferase